MPSQQAGIREPTERIEVFLDSLRDGRTGDLLTFPARTTGETWNGFAVPFFNYSVAQLIALWINRNWGLNGGHGMTALYYPEGDVFTIRDEELDPPEEKFEGVRFGNQVLYPIGAYAWCWSRP